MNHAKRLSGPHCTALMLLGATALAAAPATARAKPITVNTLTDEATPGDRLCSLREAINNANSAIDTTDGDCAAGTGDDVIDFKVKGTITLTSTLPDIVRALMIDGGGQIAIDGAFFKVLVVNSGATLAVDNLTIEGGFARFGGGIDDEGGTLTVSNSNFFGNEADIGGCGGAIFNSGPLTVTGSTFSGNSTRDGMGGAICGGGTVINSIFSGNTAVAAPGPGHFGGAIFGTVPLTISNCIFSGNAVRDGGGGAISGEGTVTNSTFSGNAGFFSAFGGAISGDLTVTNSTFLGNSAIDGGAIAGGGTVTNSTFSGNFAGNGGAIFGTPTVSNSTFSGNFTLFGTGGAIFATFPPATVSNSILAGSTSGGNCGGFGPFINGGNNISDDGTCSFGSATGSNGATIGDNVDPLLDPNGLQNNGGPTQTIALQSTSPAIDAIPAANCPPADQRGVPRPDNFETACDIGSYELFDFAGTPGQRDCRGSSISALSKQFGNLVAAASALGFTRVKALKTAIQAFCGG